MRFTSVGGTGGGCGCCGAPNVNCGTCNVPSSNLTLAWVNPLLGNGSVTLTYSATPLNWSSGCTALAGSSTQFEAVVTCTGNAIKLDITIFASPGCTGASTLCGSDQASPNGLLLGSHTCSPLSFTWTTDASNNCPSLFGPGYTSFTVHS